jgi:hypothetical protein
MSYPSPFLKPKFETNYATGESKLVNDKSKLESLVRLINDFDRIINGINIDSDFVKGQKLVIELLKAHIQ